MRFIGNNEAEARADVKVTRWRGGQHPTFEAITNKMAAEGIRPYAWTQGPNFRRPVCSHGYGKVMYCVEGALEVILPDLNQQTTLRPGDRLELPRGVRYAAIAGPSGVRCVEGELLPLLS